VCTESETEGSAEGRKEDNRGGPHNNELSVQRKIGTHDPKGFRLVKQTGNILRLRLRSAAVGLQFVRS
jgi:hypothetical protein